MAIQIIKYNDTHYSTIDLLHYRDSISK